MWASVTANPQAKLQVDGKTIIQSENVTGMYDVDPSVYNNYALNAYATLYSNNQNGGIAVSAMDNNGMARHSASFDLKSDAGGTFRSALSYVSRDAANANISSTEIISMAPGGNVGIGETDPSEKLDVNGNTRAANIFLDTNASYMGANLKYDATLAVPAWTAIDNSFGGWALRNEAGLSSCGPIGDNTGATVNMRQSVTVLPEGNMGIGTNAPEQRLDVRGSAQIGTNDANDITGSGALAVEQTPSEAMRV